MADINVALFLQLGLGTFLPFVALPLSDKENQVVLQGEQKSQAEDFLAALRASDLRLGGDLQASFELRLLDNIIGPRVGPHVKTCTYSRASGVQALIVETAYDRLPIFSKPAAGGTTTIDYDPAGNLIVWRSLRKYVLIGLEINTAVDQQECFHITPDNRIEQRIDSTLVYEYPLDTAHGPIEVEQFLLASGRAYSRNLDRISAIQLEPDGRWSLSAMGKDVMGRPCLWRLNLAELSGISLVRDASMRWLEHDVDSLHVTTSGAITADGATLASLATVFYPDPIVPYRVDVAIRSFALEGDSEHIRSVSESIKRLSASANAHYKLGDQSRPKSSAPK